MPSNQNISIQETDLAQIVNLARTDFEDLRGARLFITGGTGYIGRWLVESLLYANQVMELGVSAVVLSRDPAHFLTAHPHLDSHPSLSFVKGDVRDFDIPQEGSFSHVIHAATDVVAQMSPIQTYDVSYQGARAVLEFCRNRQVKRALLLSSGAVYGRLPSDCRHVAETYTGGPTPSSIKSAYGIGKVVMEGLGTAYGDAYGIECSSARVFAQVGPYLALDKHFAAGNFILNALKEQPFIIKGDGTPRRSYMYGVDLVVWLWRILLKGGQGKAYNVGSDVAVSIQELAQIIAERAGLKEPDIQVVGKYKEGTPIEWYVPDISKAQEELDLTLSVPFEMALDRTIAWYRQRGV